jgi:predicted nuclease with TOPRIM domain
MGFITDLLKDIPLSAVIREKLIEAEKKLSVFEQQNKNLQANLNQATKEIESLKKLNQELQRATSQKKKKLDKVTEQILKQFFDIGRDLPLEHFMSTLSLEISIVEYHFDLLLEGGFIQQATIGHSGNTLIDARFGGDSSTPNTFQITPNGRKYIVENIHT